MPISISWRSPNSYDRIEASFRVSGKRPEIWDPLTGKTREAAAFRQQDGQTILPLHLDPSSSLFVIFRTPIALDGAGKAAGNMPVFKDVLTLQEPWNVAFTPGWGAPESVTFTTLDDWSKRPEPGIKYYSGTTIYRTHFDWKEAPGQAVTLDLGKVSVIAEVKVNGVSCGIAWTPPYRVEITQALKSGRNKLEVHVANTWANRLIGDEQLDAAARRTWTTSHGFNKDSQPFESGLLGPVTLKVQKPCYGSPEGSNESNQSRLRRNEEASDG